MDNIEYKQKKEIKKMKASELIQKLQEIIESDGDLDIRLWDDSKKDFSNTHIDDTYVHSNISENYDKFIAIEYTN